MPSFGDFEIFWRSGQLVLSGQSPYHEGAFFYPYPTALWFALWALIPLAVSKWLWFSLSLVAIVFVGRRRALAIAAFPPVLASLWLGQLDCLLLGLLGLVKEDKWAGWAVALLTLKPQIVVLLLPWLIWHWWRENKRALRDFGIASLVIWGGSFALAPNWFSEWRSHTRPIIQSMEASPSLWGLTHYAMIFVPVVALISLVLLFYSVRQKSFDVANCLSFLINPAIITYDLTLLAVSWKRWWFVPLLIGWLAVFLSNSPLLQHGLPYSLVTLATLILILNTPGQVRL
jgi:hypothetical protein